MNGVMRFIALAIVAMTLVSVVAAAQAQNTWSTLALKYKEVLVRSPDDAQTRYSLAMVYAHEGQLLEGWRQLETLGKQLNGAQQQFASQVISESARTLQRTPADILTRYRLAFALYFAGQKNAARQQFEKIVALEPNHSWSLGYLGYGYMERGDLDQAIALWERGIKADPGNAVLHYVLGIAYTRKGEVKKAAGHFVAAYRNRSLYEYVKGQGK